MRVAKFFILVLTVFCAYVLITMRMNQPELTLPDFVAAPAVPASSVATPVPLPRPCLGRTPSSWARPDHLRSCLAVGRSLLDAVPPLPSFVDEPLKHKN